jgi:hypothetical protein
MNPEQHPLLKLPEGNLRDQHGNPFTAPPDGALGLLALGWDGIRLWRRARDSMDNKQLSLDNDVDNPKA